ncbi:MAG: glucose-1-phosphate cytidylyltransferase [Anaerolineales bacterium]
MNIVILCGGKGTRLREKTEEIPKPLVEIGGRPILWHVMKLYAHYGIQDFILCLGYKGVQIKEYCVNSNTWRLSNFSLSTGGNGSKIRLLDSELERWNIAFIDTGLDTRTGGRVKRIQPYIKGDLFMATYADGLADIDISALLEFHKRHGRIATVTAVRPASQFGIMQLNGDGRVAEFVEKPRLNEWVNGGFFVFDYRFFDYLEENSVLEQEPLERLAQEGEIMAYRHEGFWACMDTYKDTATLNSLWRSHQAPWEMWSLMPERQP